MSHSRSPRTGRALYVGKDTRTPENACLDCGKVLDAAFGVGHRSKPHPGGITICMDCGHVQVFDGQLKFRALTDQEIIDIAGDEVILITQKARADYAKREGKTNG